MEPRSKDWLRRVLEDACREVASWPEWKRELGRQTMKELGKPYVQTRRYPVARDGMII